MTRAELLTHRFPILHALLAVLVCLPAAATDADVFSVYVPTRDDTRIAVDIALPADRAEGAKLPTLIELTRYWRASEHPASGEPKPWLDAWEREFLAHGYAVVQVDVRGSGASFGSRDIEYGPQEVNDGWDVVEWIVGQPWSDGKVGAHGISYSGTTAELLTATGHPAIKAVSPGWSDFDTWRSPARPYGLFAADFVEMWGQYVGMLDRNDPALGGKVKRVDEDLDGKLRDQAVAQHAANLAIGSAAGAVDFRDEALPGSERTFADISSLRWRKQIEESAVPMLVIASWFDAASAEGALWRLANFSNLQYVVIQASNHGGSVHASPYTVDKRPLPARLPLKEQIDMRLEFFDHYLKGADNDVAGWPRVRYFNLGEERYKESDVWPPQGMQRRRLYAHGDGALSADPPAEEAGADRYEVDFEVSTGRRNRWITQMGEPVLGLSDRGAMDTRMLTYTGEALGEDLQISGTPWVHLELASTHADGAVLVYLEDVDPQGRSRYLTEGGLRLIHRRLDNAPGFDAPGPLHSFAREDALPMVPGETAAVEIRLNPISVRLARGHRLRVAISGADAGSFDRVPAEGTPTLTLERNASHASYLELPVVEKR